MSLRQRNKKRNKPQENVVKTNFSGCHNCGHETMSRSPTGDWCNNCGRQSPCPCYLGEHDKCFDHLLKKAKENNLNIPKSCCCGDPK